MKRVLQLALCFITLVSFSQTQVGIVQFNDVDDFNGTELVLNGAGERDKLYVLGLYLDLDFNLDDLKNGVKVAEADATMAVTIKVISNSITHKELKNLIRMGLERATDGNSYVFEKETRDFIGFMPDEIQKFDIFKILHTKGGKITLFKNKQVLGTLESLEFKKALFKIWLGDNPVNEKLRDEILGSVNQNPVLGRWKTFDRKTGVAINIVQIYTIKNELFGTIEQMLRQSQRDDVCFECKGADKNKKVEGLTIIKELKLKGENKYAGRFTNIIDGKVSNCQIWVEEDDHDILYVKYKGGGGVHKWKRMK